MEGAILLLFFAWGLPILICWNLGQSRNRTGWAWGLLLGWLGVLILALMRPIQPHERLLNQQAAKQLDKPDGILPRSWRDR